jgi:hypothetical protein
MTGTNSGGPPTDDDYITIAYDASTGVRRWLKRYDGPDHAYDVASSLSLAPDGSKVYITGRSYRFASNEDYLTIGYDVATGARLWVRRYDGPVSHDDQASSVVASSDGSKAFVTGKSWREHNGYNGYDYATVAYDASTGTWLWTTRYNGIGGNFGDVATAVASSPDGATAFVTGSSSGIRSGGDIVTIAYDASTGTERWARRTNGSGNDYDAANAIAASPDGSKVFITGRSDPAEGFGDYADFFSIAYDAANGRLVWKARYDSPGDQSFDEPVSIAAGPDGSRVFVTGESPGDQPTNDYRTIAYDASTGVEVWNRTFDGMAHHHDYAYSVAVSRDGSAVFVTGQTQQGSGEGGDWMTVAYEA